MTNILRINNNTNVSSEELNTILTKQHLQINSIIEIVFLNNISRIDIVFIAGLILLYKEYKIKFIITYNNLESKRIFEIRQYLKQFQELYHVIWNDIFPKFKGIVNLEHSDYIASSSFVPILFITDKTIDNIFKVSINSQSTSDLSDLCYKYHIYNDKDNSQSEIQYQNSDFSIFQILNEYPPIYTFTFIILYNKIRPFTKNSYSLNDNPIKRTVELWEFTKEYIKGLYELAKNIIEHSDYKKGMITIRVYDDLYIDNAEIENKILETYVFDYGVKGIITKLTEYTLLNKNKNKAFAEDLEIINSSFSIKDFIKPSVSKLLNQQLYRDIAHFGLMKFFKLIDKNKGIIVTSTIDKHLSLDIYSNSPIDTKKHLNIGTSFYFKLPFKNELYKALDQASNISDMHGSPQTINSLSELMNIRSIINVQEIKTDKLIEEKYLMCLNISTNIKNRKDEINLFKSLISIASNNQINYIAINMQLISLTSSSLLRFLAYLSTNFSQLFIIYNLNYDIYEEMINDNLTFYNYLKDMETEIPYWYHDKGILIYSKPTGVEFNFADLLYGETELEFHSVNQVISNTFPNTVSILQHNIPKLKDFIVPSCLQKYFYKASLLPFDLLLYNNNKKSLFQINLESLLNQELNSTKIH